MKAYPYPEDQVKRLIAETSQSFFEQNFPSRSYIEGDEIVQFSGNPQVNRFLLFQIYQEWNLYITKLKHPYFDFQHVEVRDALAAFQNILSQHIRVERADFKPLLDKAIYNTFRLILQPMETLTGFFFLSKPSVSASQFERYAHYFCDFDFIVGSLNAYYAKHNAQEVERADFIEKAEKLAALYEKRSEQTLDEYRGILFHKLTGQELKSLLEAQAKPPAAGQPPFSFDELDSLLSEAAPKAAPQPPAATVQPVEAQESVQSLKELESLARKLFNPEARPADSSPAPSPQPEKPQQAPAPAPKPATPAPAPPPAASVQAKVDTGETPPNLSRLADQFQNENRNLNSLFNKKEKSGAILIESIPMHKQFQYVQKVFAGNRKLFKDTIDVVNQLSTQEEALEYLNARILNMPEVNREEPVTQEFVELVRNRF